MHLPIKNYIYLDDILGTGKTVYVDLHNWLSQNDNLEKVINDEIQIYVRVC
jgi:hypothetical protein